MDFQRDKTWYNAWKSVKSVQDFHIEIFRKLNILHIFFFCLPENFVSFAIKRTKFHVINVINLNGFTVLFQNIRATKIKKLWLHKNLISYHWKGFLIFSNQGNEMHVYNYSNYIILHVSLMNLFTYFCTSTLYPRKSCFSNLLVSYFH